MTDHRTSERIAFWLLPDENNRRWLKTIIDQLSIELETPHFEPHVTLLSAPLESFPDPASTLAGLARTIHPLVLECSNPMCWNRRYSQALIQPLTLSVELADLVSSLHPRKKVPADYNPHISLLYDHLEKSVGEELVKRIRLATRSVRFDRCAAVKIGPDWNCAEHVARLEVIATLALTTGLA